MDRVIRFRVSDVDRLLLRRAAARDARSLSDWCRLRLVGYARSELAGDVLPEEGLGSPSEVLSPGTKPRVTKSARQAGKSLAASRAEAAYIREHPDATIVRATKDGVIVEKPAGPPKIDPEKLAAFQRQMAGKGKK